MGDHVAFDIGNVLCHFDIVKFTDTLQRYVGGTERNAWGFLDYLQRMQDIGVTTVAQSLEHSYPFLSESDRAELVDVWNKTVTPNEMMLSFLEKLRGDGVKVAFLSNMGQEHLAYLRSTCPQMFEGVVQHISCEVGARKPTKMFFQSFCLDNDEFCVFKDEDGNRIDYSGCVYVDDLEENLRVGKRYGFKVYNLNLEELVKLPQSRQKTELDKLKLMIFNKV
ncbi:MAG TPA: hypothetical protein VI423_06950 [Paenisporosarcina sp.]|nr:hypothetical protein [Paenisporosarcina sp.]